MFESILDPAQALEEERKRREEEERRRQEEAANAKPSFGDIASQAFDARVNAAKDNFNNTMSMFSNPEEALRQRLSPVAQAMEDPAAYARQRLLQQPMALAQPKQEEPTPVKQTITTDPETGEQTVKIEGNARDLSAANPLTPTVTGPVAPAQQAQQEQQLAQQLAQYRAPQAQPRALAQLPAQGAIPAQAAQMPVPEVRLPQPGPGVQVASAQPGMTVQPPAMPVAPTPVAPAATAPAPVATAPTPVVQAPPAAPAPAVQAPPAWITAANDAGNDFNKLLDVAAKHPESRDAISEKLKASFVSKTKEDEANNLFKAAAAGDVKAQNKIFQLIKPETGKPKEEVTTGDYVRAYMYKRLGLDALAQDVQNKIIGKETKFGQITVGGSNWQVETDPSGQIIRAKDDEGNVATESTLNKLRAAGQKFGAQAFSTTGGSVTIPAGQPNAGEEYRTVFNSTTGQFENKIITGADAGKTYTGPAGLEKRVATNAAVALNDAFIKFQTAPSTAAATEALKTAALLSPEDYNKTLQFIQRTQPGIYNEVSKTLPGGLGGGGAPAPAPAPAATSFSDPSIKIISSQRSTAQQQALYDQSVAAGTPGRLPNGNPVAKPGTSAHEGGNAIDVDAKSLTRAGRQELAQKGYYQPLPNDPNHWELLPGRQAPAGAPAGGGGLLQRTEQVKTDVGVAGKRSESFNKILDEEVRPEGQKGDAISAKRKQQLEIFDRPGVDMNKIFGLATGAGRSAGDQSWTMVRDVLLGRFEGKADDIKQRAAALGLNPAEQSALAEYQIANVDVNAANLRKTAGAGSVSDAEQKVNREAGVDPTKVPALGAYNAISQSKFDADKARWKADWAENHPATNALQLDKAWRQESSRLTDLYSNIAKDRLKYITENGSTTAAVKEGYKRFPIPEYVPGEGWKKTKPLSSFNR